MAAAAPAALAMQVASNIANGIEQNRAAKAGARVDQENARLSLLEGEQQADATRTQERLQAGEMIAGMGGAGIQLGSGSAADLLAESSYQRELEVLNVRTTSTRQANNLYQSASDKRAAGKAALIGGMFGAAASAIQGVSQMRVQRAVESGRVAAPMGGGTVPRPSIVGVSR